jgi:sensor c-di-GMP phosphodiesterase-like protein
MVEFGHALGCTVVAEGVETDDQPTQVRDAGCDGAQGFLFGPAVSRAEAEALLVAGRPHARSVKPAPRTVRISGGEPSLRRSRVT